MGAQHTATPWQAVAGKTTGQEVISFAAVSKSRHVVGRFGGPDREANARLFVAAPDLLEFAKALDAYWTAEFSEGPDGECKCGPLGLGTLADDSRALWRQCRAAILRATSPDSQGPVS